MLDVPKGPLLVVGVCEASAQLLFMIGASNLPGILLPIINQLFMVRREGGLSLCLPSAPCESLVIPALSYPSPKRRIGSVTSCICIPSRPLDDYTVVVVSSSFQRAPQSDYRPVFADDTPSEAPIGAACSYAHEHEGICRWALVTIKQSPHRVHTFRCGT